MVITLAAGVGVAAGILMAIDGVLLRSFPYPSHSRIVVFTAAHPQAFVKFNRNVPVVNPPELRSSGAFASVAAVSQGRVTFGHRIREALHCSLVGPRFFDVLGADALIGRPIAPSDLGQQVAVLSHPTWTRLFASDHTAIGRTIALNNRTFVVIGVMPRGVEYPGRSDVWIPYGSLEEPASNGVPTPTVIARLAPDMSLALAADEVLRIAEPHDRDGFRLVRLREAVLGDVETLLLLTGLAALLVLVLSSTNTSGLMLTRIAAREREMATRIAVGASRARIASDILIEGLLLAAAAGIASVPLMWWTVQAVQVAVPLDIPGVQDISVSAEVYLLTATLAIIVGVACGLTPLIFVRRAGRTCDALRGASMATLDGSWWRFQAAMIIAVVAVSLTLMTTTTIVIRRLGAMATQGIGVRDEASFVFDIDPAANGYDTPSQAHRLVEGLIQALRDVPSIQNVAATDRVPADVGATFARTVPVPLPEGQTLRSVTPGTHGGFRATTQGLEMAPLLCATPDFFSVLGIELIAGRVFDKWDNAGAAPVAIVTEQFARANRRGSTDVIGQRLNLAATLGAPSVPAEIVGVVRDFRLLGPRDHFRPLVYAPCAQQFPDRHRISLIIKTNDDRLGLATVVRQLVAHVDGTLLVSDIRSFRDVISAHTSHERFAAAVMLAIGTVAALVAMCGLYALTNYTVQRRTREIGIKLALGASAASIQRETLMRPLMLAAIGVLVAGPCTVALFKAVDSRSLRLGELEPEIWLIVGGMLLVIATLAAWRPGARATRVDPVVALRTD